MIKCLVLLSGTVLIGKVEEVAAELGDPNCQVTDYYEITSDGIKKWLNFTNEKNPYAQIGKYFNNCRT